MSDVRKAEAERLAELTWKAKRERIVRDFGEERNRVINRVTHGGNAGGYLPALIQWAVERLNASISAQADAYIETFNAFHLPCDETAEKKLWQATSEFAAGSIMNVRNDHSVKRHRLGLGSPWHLEIEREMHTSAKEAIARLRHQRAAVQNHPKEVVVNQTFNATGPNSRNNVNSTDNSTNIVHQGVPLRGVAKSYRIGCRGWNEACRHSANARQSRIGAGSRVRLDALSAVHRCGCGLHDAHRAVSTGLGPLGS